MRLKVSMSMRLAPGAPSFSTAVMGGANLESQMSVCFSGDPAAGHCESSRVSLA